MIYKVSVTENLLFSPDLIASNYKGIPLENNISFLIKARENTNKLRGINSHINQYIHM